ncbi:cell division ATP-binding protein FtsE [bacterium]|nr:cell division ATP-binding protein FtsE [bacterium]|tara:strand:+ start:4222 stop:4884 length:663 start_codon:yes stop_codon:yes gene_type:complete
MISFQKVTKTYNHKLHALEKASFKIQPNEFVMLVGKSGAGKSTILKLLIGEEKPTSGKILFNSLEVNKLKPGDMPDLRRQIGVIFQDFRLLEQKTAQENVAFALEVEGRPQREIEELVPQVLDMVGIKDKANNFPRELSGGEKQRVAIARAMINRPKVLIADEPTGNLDHHNSSEVIKLLIKINELGSTVILATHDKDVVDTLDQRRITLDKGRIIKDEA